MSLVDVRTLSSLIQLIFFFNDTATTEIYTLSLHDALPISLRLTIGQQSGGLQVSLFRELRSPSCVLVSSLIFLFAIAVGRSEEHTSELQSRLHLVCRLLLEKKKTSRKCCSLVCD